MSRTFNPKTIRPTGTHAVQAEDGAATNQTATSSSPWLDPMRLVRSLRRNLWLWLVILSTVGATSGFAFGLIAFSASYSLTASVQLQPPATPFTASEDTVAYNPPSLNPNEVKSLFDQWFIYERLLPMVASSENIQHFRNRFLIQYAHESRVFRVQFRDADSPRQAEEILATQFQIVLMSARDILINRVQDDLDYFRRSVTEAEQELAVTQRALDAYRKDKGITYLNLKVEQHHNRIILLEEELRKRQRALDELDHQIEELPKLIDTLPEFSESPLQVPQPADPSLVELRASVRNLEQIYTEAHPKLVRAREQLKALEQDQAQANKETPNPFVLRLEEQLRLAELQRPQVKRLAVEIIDELNQAKADLKLLPEESSQFIKLDMQRERQENLAKRLRIRLAEIEIARNLSVNALRILDPPNAHHAEVFKRSHKVIITIGIGFILGAGLACCIGLLLSIRDRRLHSMSDLVLVLNAERVALLPHGEKVTPSDLKAWVREVCGHMSSTHKKFICLCNGDITEQSRLAFAIAQQFSRAGLNTLLVANLPEGLLEKGKPSTNQPDNTTAHHTTAQKDPPANDKANESALDNPNKLGAQADNDPDKHTDFIFAPAKATRMHPFASQNIEPHLEHFSWGNIEELLDRIPAGYLDQFLRDQVDDFVANDITIYVPPVNDPTLIKHLAPHAEAIVAIVDNSLHCGNHLRDLLDMAQLPVAMGIITK